jgi:FAD/FMN-containing dehydrogenase
MFNYVSETRNFSWMIIANLYGGIESAINEFPASESANSLSSYGHRNAGYVMQMYVMTPDNRLPWDENIIPYVEGVVASLGDEATHLMAYAPYVDPQFSREEAQRKYWGEGAARLRALKKAYDPEEVFDWPQGF